MNLLLLSNSTMPVEPYLDFPKHDIAIFLGEKKVNALFIPYAGVTISHNEYERRVKERFNEVGHDITSIHHFNNPIEAVNNAEAIVVGGGNTWQLLNMIKTNGLIEPIRNKVNSGTKYIGWSAGSNLACPTIKTTNDMPIVEPKGFNALSLIPFQINPHYLDKTPEGHGGESREDRILEFIEVNRSTTVAGLREGCMFKIVDNNILYKGSLPVRIFKYGKEPYEVNSNDDFNFLINLNSI